MDPPDREDAGDPAARADDDLAADLLTEDPVRRAYVVTALGRHGRGLQAEPVRSDCPRRLVHDAVARLAPTAERQVEARERQLDPDDFRVEDAESRFQQLLAGLVAFEHDDGPGIHGGEV